MGAMRNAYKSFHGKQDEPSDNESHVKFILNRV
jgi:hypothetical protein